MDGTEHSNGTNLFYIPEKFNNITNPGKFIECKWDKYSRNSKGECVYDYQSSGGLVGEFWDLNNPS